MVLSYDVIKKNEDKEKIELNVFKYFARLLDFYILGCFFYSIKLELYNSINLVL